MPPQPPTSPLARACELIDRARYADAADLLRRHAQRHPGDAAAVGALCHALLNLGQPEQAVFYATALRRASPMVPGVYATLGEALDKAGKGEQAIAALQDGLTLFPQDPQIAFVLAETLRSKGRHADAIQIVDRALAEGWANDALRSVRATSMHKLGMLKEAMAFARESQWIAPGRLAPAELAAVTANYDPDITAQQAFALHKRYANTLNDHVGSGMFTFPATDDPDRPLRVGVLSPDLRRHSVGFFALPMLRALKGHMHLRAYYSGPPGSTTSDRFRSLCDSWTVVTGMNMAALARLIHEDRVDILIELSGLTLGQAMPLMQVRPAPVQITYIGYPSSTGLSNIDYRIVDSFTDPPGAEALASERLIRLDPCFLCFEPWETPPPVAPPPSAGGAPLTFGSFNNSMKINDKTLALWGRVLAAVPGSRLFAKMLEGDHAGTNEFMLRRLADHGIPRERVVWKTWEKDLKSHLSTYDQIDIGLDPTPYCGTTTTIEAMLMGVPVVSLVGDRHAARVGLSLLHNVGLPELAASDEDAYVAAALALANDPARLSSIRGSLRDRVLSGSLGDQPAYAQRLRAALRAAWAQRCRAKP
ncbi:MAG: hypothetical protein DYG92_10410 [Leptolyngbya sp. PLA1]|nr:hypothetical protein [Leptolyngbya sp. PLA1]